MHDPEIAPDPFPKAPVVPFPRESTTIGLTSMYDVLVSAGIPSALISGDRSVKFVSPPAQELLGLSADDNVSLKQLEMLLGFSVPDSGQTFSLTVMLQGKKTNITVVPLSGGAGGHVVILKHDVDTEASDTALMTFVREAVTAPLGALQAALAAAALRRKDPMLQDAVNTIDQILSSLELAPRSEMPPLVISKGRAKHEEISHVLQRLVDNYKSLAEIKGIQLQIDSPESKE
ncbi:MAG: hypothetical protein ABIP29_03120, partial [Candidatus Eisenbacteria bacterium]